MNQIHLTLKSFQGIYIGKSTKKILEIIGFIKNSANNRHPNFASPLAPKKKRERFDGATSHLSVRQVKPRGWEAGTAYKKTQKNGGPFKVQAEEWSDPALLAVGNIRGGTKGYALKSYFNNTLQIRHAHPRIIGNIPGKNKKMTLIKSPHVYKKSREQFQWSREKRLIVVNADGVECNLLLLLLKNSQFPGVQLKIDSYFYSFPKQIDRI